MTRELRRGAAISGAVHVLLALALLFGIPVPTTPEEPEETSVAMVFQGTAQQSMRADNPAPVPAPAATPTPVQRQTGFVSSRAIIRMVVAHIER
jgi:hypothetical protein